MKYRLPPKNPDRTFDMTLTVFTGITWANIEDEIWMGGITAVQVLSEYHTQSGRKLTIRVSTDIQDTKYVQDLRGRILTRLQFIAKE
jgi:hypothetical protein